MDQRRKRILITAIVVFIVASIASIIYFIIVPKIPSTQQPTKTVIIDNYAQYGGHISADSFGSLGNYLYGYIKNPSQSVYHAKVTDKSYSYASDSWFSTFIVQLNNSSISWQVSMQTIADGSINGDISVSCHSGGDACLAVSSIQSTAPKTLQDDLPITTNDYIINVQTNNNNALSIIYYDQAGTGKTEAIDKIKSLGFNPDDYTIQYFYGGND
jgi:hypothetical protein